MYHGATNTPSSPPPHHHGHSITTDATAATPTPALLPLNHTLHSMQPPTPITHSSHPLTHSPIHSYTHTTHSLARSPTHSNTPPLPPNEMKSDATYSPTNSGLSHYQLLQPCDTSLHLPPSTTSCKCIQRYLAHNKLPPARTLQ